MKLNKHNESPPPSVHNTFYVALNALQSSCQKCLLGEGPKRVGIFPQENILSFKFAHLNMLNGLI